VGESGVTGGAAAVAAVEEELEVSAMAWPGVV
jgi:hypothetical protein